MSAPHAQLPGNWNAVRRRLLLIGVALALGGVAFAVMTEYMASLQALARTDVLAARAKLATLFRAMALGLFPLTGAIGVFLAGACRRSFAIDRFPPPGSGAFWQGGRTFTGPAARRVATAMLVLSILLVVCSIAGGALSWWIADRLLACRA